MQEKNVPEIRFKGFEEEWGKRKFHELYKRSVLKNDLTYGIDHIISVANMYFSNNTNISNEEYLKTYNIFKLGDIAFEGNKSDQFSHGRFVENSIGDGIVSHIFEVYTPIMKDYDIEFWKYKINNELLMKQILMRSTKSSTMMTNLVEKDFLSESVNVPIFQEQKKIGLFLNRIDHIINYSKNKIDLSQIP